MAGRAGVGRVPGARRLLGIGWAGQSWPAASPAGPPTVSTAALCASPVLRIRAGREGESQGAHGDIEFTNVGSRPCELRGLPRVAIIAANGKSLPLQLVRASNRSLSPVVLPAGRPDPSTISVVDAYQPA
ncbi:MAG TPA: DUF4232 domain-containing protein [Trebonia sp.]|jgi:hypothetical protein|nr:DUF4232 domain-containing protein [Trebonia sp.]